MRMWNVRPDYLCRKHLLGEHVEMHMFVGVIKKGISLKGYIENKLVETDKIQQRHDELSIEMISRGFNHKSPIDSVDIPAVGNIDIVGNIKELIKRCPDCKERLSNDGWGE